MTGTRTRQGLVTAGLILLGVGVVAALSMTGTGPSSRAADIPGDTVVATLSSGAGPEGLAPLLAATRSAPTDRNAAHAAAAALIVAGRRAGDSRLVGAALPVLRPFLDTGATAETLRLAAEARQYQHDFPGALTLLDRAIQTDPQATDALLMRSTVHLVQGDLQKAEQDCALIHALRPDIGLMCQSTALTMTDAAPAVASRLTDLMQSGRLDPTLHTWATSLLGEIALLQNQPDQAETHLRQVLLSDRFALRERLMLADLMLSQSRNTDVIALLADAPATDGVLIRRALATGDAGITEQLATRVTQNLQLGLTAHAREDAMYYLLLARDPVQALDRARTNWALQHEFEDATLLLTAADAAGQPAAAQPVLDWIKANNITVPRLTIPASIAALAK